MRHAFTLPTIATELQRHSGDLMKLLVGIGLAMVVCWGVLWLGIKIAVGAVHLLLLLGAVLIIWGFIKGRSLSKAGP